MANFCGQCGNRLDAGDRFCSSCGTPIPVAATCPTCGQPWPEGSAPPPAAPATAATSVTPAVPEGEVRLGAPVAVRNYSRGAYESTAGPVYFDGSGWFRARELAGLWVPEAMSPLPGFIPDAVVGSQLFEEPGASLLPRGPLLGPDYDPQRDCGNCGFDLGGATGECAHCGTRNTGASFIPGG